MRRRIANRSELVALVRRIMNAEGSEEEQNEMLQTLQASVLDPNVSNLIYYPPGGIELTAEEVVDRALAYKPMQL